jgi:hypothetical protein
MAKNMQSAVSVESPMRSADLAARLEVAVVVAAATVHSENNLRQWREYLPEECIAQMVHMGWDIST